MTKDLKYILSVLSLLTVHCGFGQSQIVKGQVLSDDQKPLDQATVQILNIKQNLFTDHEGRFSVELEDNDNKDLIFRISYTGCDRLDTTIQKESILEPLIIQLACSNQIEEVVIRSFYPVKRNTSTVVTVDKIKNQPVLFGEPDVYKTLQSMPGINFGAEGSADLVVRGGSVSENLYVLDNIPLYAGSHLFGLMTPVNGDLLEEVHVYKNGFPAQYGGRLSSVVDMKSTPFDKMEKKLALRAGLLNNTVQFTDRIGEHVAINLSARRTLLDVASKFYSSVIHRTNDEVLPAFGDVYGKVSARIGEGQYVRASTLWTHDRFLDGSEDGKTDQEETFQWQTPTAMIGYSKVNDRSRISLDVGKSWYRYEAYSSYIVNQEPDIIRDIESSGIRNEMTTAHLKGTYKLNEDMALTAGSQYSRKKYRNRNSFEEYDVRSGDTISLKSQTLQNYISLNFEKPWTSSSLGLHMISLPGDDFLTVVEPRLYLDYRLAGHKWYFTWSRMHQTDHLIANRSIGIYLKTWIPSSSQYPPAQSDEYGLGYSWSFGSGSINAEFYYKNRTGLAHPQEGHLSFITKLNLDDLLHDGVGTAKGMELSGLWYIGDKHKLEASYSLSKSMLRFHDLNNGVSFPDYFDRRHNIKVGHSWNLSDTWKLHSQFTLLTGVPFTYLQGIYPGLLYDPKEASIISGSVPYNTILYFDGLNNKRLPAHHRLDISVHKKLKSKRWPSILGFGVYNVYARTNPMFVEITTAKSQPPLGRPTPNDQLKYNLVSYFNFIPYVNISINFW
ncbi:MAG TPA: TonB-dependent receptor plug domain-containing protein [Membranihabitans sp.]|nr:TonB-dependent receptor plug domain-containing protein [Membranihabitans sp.]